MKPSRENIFAALARIEQSGGLPEDGPTSVFLRSPGAHTTQLAVRVDGDAVFVRASRLPFARPLVFSRQALRVHPVAAGPNRPAK